MLFTQVLDLCVYMYTWYMRILLIPSKLPTTLVMTLFVASRRYIIQYSHIIYKYMYIHNIYIYIYSYAQIRVVTQAAGHHAKPPVHPSLIRSRFNGLGSRSQTMRGCYHKPGALLSIMLPHPNMVCFPAKQRYVDLRGRVSI